MNILSQVELISARRRAARDAEAGVNMVDDFIREVLGPRPRWDPTTRHSHLSDRLSRGADINEIDSIVREAQMNRASLFPRWLCLIGTVGFAVTETLAIVQILKLEGVEPFARLLLGAATSAFAIAITNQVAQAVQHLMKRDRAWPLWRIFGSMAAYAGFIAVCTLLRAEDSGNSTVLFALLMGWATVGAPWLAELCLHGYRTASPRRDVLRTLGRERRTLSRQRDSAAKARERIERDAENWERREQQLRAAYVSTWQFASSRRSATGHALVAGRQLPPGQ